MLSERIAELERELQTLKYIKEDYIQNGYPVCNLRTDAVYMDFCNRHPDAEISKRKFTVVLCREMGLKTVQSWLDGERGYFYERDRVSQ